MHPLLIFLTISGDTRMGASRPVDLIFAALGASTDLNAWAAFPESGRPLCAPDQSFQKPLKRNRSTEHYISETPTRRNRIIRYG